MSLRAIADRIVDDFSCHDQASVSGDRLIVESSTFFYVKEIALWGCVLFIIIGLVFVSVHFLTGIVQALGVCFCIVLGRSLSVYLYHHRYAEKRQGRVKLEVVPEKVMILRHDHSCKISRSMITKAEYVAALETTDGRTQSSHYPHIKLYLRDPAIFAKKRKNSDWDLYLQKTNGCILVDHLHLSETDWHTVSKEISRLLDIPLVAS